MSIGANIRRIREKKGISQVELARKVNVTQAMLCQIERGTKSLTLPLGMEIAAALGCDVNELAKSEISI